MSRQRIDVSQLSPEERALLRAEAMRRALAIVDRYAPPLLFLLAFAARLFAATAIHFPALDDPAYYLKVAENLAAGRGLTIDAIWGYLVPVDTVSHASNEHWMPLASLMLAPFFAAFGAGFPLAQTVGAGVGALLAPLGWGVARQVLADQARWRGYALFTGIFLAFNPLLIYQAVTGDSAVWFGVLGTLTAVLGGGLALRSNGGALLAGAVVGLAYLARTEGLLLAVVLLAWVWLQTAREVRVQRTLLCLAGVLALALPWWLRNTLTFGSPMPVPSLLLATIPDYAALFHYPGATGADPYPTATLSQHLSLRLEGFGTNVAVLLRGLFPAAPLALVGAVRLRSAPALRVHLCVAGGLFLATALLFPVLTINGTFYHAAGAVLPALALLSGYGLFVTARALARRFAPNTAALFGQLLCAGAVVLQLFQLGSALDLTSEGHQVWERKFGVAAEWLAGQPAGPVLTNQPNRLHYVTGRPTVMLPLPDAPETARVVAQRYGATHLVAFWELGPFGDTLRYPEALKDGAAGFEEVFARDGVTVYRIR